MTEKQGLRELTKLVAAREKADETYRRVPEVIRRVARESPLTAQVVADELGISKSYIYRLLRES